MPVQRFRSLDEARRALWTARDDPGHLRRLQAVCRLAALPVTIPPPRGVRKFRTIGEANAEREAWVDHRVHVLRSERDRR